VFGHSDLGQYNIIVDPETLKINAMISGPHGLNALFGNDLVPVLPWTGRKTTWTDAENGRWLTATRL
jgi:hypothetical protein